MTPAYRYAAVVRRVVDGDTIDVDLDLGFRLTSFLRLRVRDIDCPEHGTDAGDAATAYVRTRLPVGTAVVLDTSKPDKYGRTLAAVTYVWDGADHDLAADLIADGHARSYDGGHKAAW